MTKVYKNESGFSVVEAILIVVIVALIGVVGWLVYKNHHKTTHVNTTNTSVTQPTMSTSTKSTTTTTPVQTAKYLAVAQLGIKIPLNSTIADLSYSWDPSQSDAWFGSAKLGQESISPQSNCGITSTPQTFNQSLSPDPTDPDPIELNDILVGTVSKLAAGDSTSGWTDTVTVRGTTYGFKVFPTNCSSTQTFETDLSNYISSFEIQFTKATAIN